MDFPCIKCLTYPLCKHKERVICEDIYHYINERNSFPLEMPKLLHVKLGKHSLYGLNKSTTRWFPDS